MGSIRPPTEYANSIISERALDETRPLKVVYIGAGISGIVAGILLPKLVPNIELTIFEKNEDVGGTWFENKYPGCACDIPSHSYQLSFEPNVEWSKFYVEAPEILRYWQGVADKYNVRRLIKFRHKCVEARWNESTSKWNVRVHSMETGQYLEETADAFVTGVGFLNDWRWPDIDGLHSFGGKLMHSANWDSSCDLKDKRIAIVGAGSSGIQLVTKLQPQVKSIDHYIRGRTWISTSFGHELVRERNDGNDGNFTYDESEVSTWKSDPAAYLAYRKSVELAMQRGFIATHYNTPELAGATAFFESEMRRRSTPDPSVASQLIPPFPPFCKRITPGPGYLEALTSSNVNVISAPISHITQTGITTGQPSPSSSSIELAQQEHRPVDAIICATGFNTSFIHRQPTIYGRGSLPLDARYTPRAEAYMGMCVDDFPNFFHILGPNSGFANGNFIVIIELYTAYMAEILRKLGQSNVRTVQVKQSAVKGFADFCDAFFDRTVFSARCSSWYKSPRYPGGDRADGRVSALWPGSCAHAMKVFRAGVRWEDFEVATVDDKPMGWLGNGLCEAEKEEREGWEDELVWFLGKEGGLAPGEGQRVV